MKRIIFVDIRNKLRDEASLPKFINDSDDIISLTPYSSYLLDKFNFDFTPFSVLKSNYKFHADVISDYKTIENHSKFHELGEAKFILRDIAKYVTFDHYLRVLKEKIIHKHSLYISSADESSEFGKNALLSQFIDFSSTIALMSDKGFYNWNKTKKFIKKIRENFSFNILSKIKNKGNYEYDNSLNVSDYKEIIINTDSKVDFSLIKFKAIKALSELITDPKLKILMRKQMSLLLAYKPSKPQYIPFTFLNENTMYARFLAYKSNNIPVIVMQHGSYVHENYFLKYNEILAADINLVFNRYSKKLFEDLGANKVYCVGTNEYSKKIRIRRMRYDYVYISYCTQYSYPGFYIGSKHFNLSTTSEDIYKRHQDVIEMFGRNHPEKKICIKVQPGIFLSNQMYIPLKELSAKYPNITINYESSLFSLIEKSKYVISDYFSSELSNRNILQNRDVILFGDIIKIHDADVLRDLRELFIVVDSVAEMSNVVTNIDIRSKLKVNSKKLTLLERYSSSHLNTKLEVKKIINRYL
jgi:hypothetical protein